MGIDQSSVIGGESTEIPDCLRCAELDVLRSWWSKLQERGGGRATVYLGKQDICISIKYGMCCLKDTHPLCSVLQVVETRINHLSRFSRAARDINQSKPIVLLNVNVMVQF